MKKALLDPFSHLILCGGNPYTQGHLHQRQMWAQEGSESTSISQLVNGPASSWTQVRYTSKFGRRGSKCSNFRCSSCVPRVKQTRPRPEPSSGSIWREGRWSAVRESRAWRQARRTPHAVQDFLGDAASFVDVFIHLNLMPTIGTFQKVFSNSSYEDISIWGKKMDSRPGRVWKQKLCHVPPPLETDLSPSFTGTCSGNYWPRGS